jgi:hypothetical protein
VFAVKSLTLSVAGRNVQILEMVVICTETDSNVGLKYLGIQWFGRSQSSPRKYLKKYLLQISIEHLIFTKKLLKV